MLLEELAGTCNQLLRDGQYETVLRTCDEALASDLTSTERCRVLRLQARAYLARDGWCAQAQACLGDALSASAEGSVDRGLVLASCAAAYATIPAVDKCLEARDQFLRIYQNDPDEVLARVYPDIEYNLALAYHEMDMLEEALSGYTQALRATAGSSDPYVLSLRQHVENNLIDIHQEMDEPQYAGALINHCYSILPEETHGAQMRNRRAIQALLTGDLASALLWVESGLGHPSCDLKTKAALLLTRARLARAGGAESAAHETALEAARLANQARSSRLSSRAFRFIRELTKGGTS